jgi:hypothetical protein
MVPDIRAHLEHEIPLVRTRSWFVEFDQHLNCDLDTVPNSFLVSAQVGAKCITSPSARAYRSSGLVLFSAQGRACCFNGFQGRKAGY